MLTPATDSQIYRSSDEGVTWKKTAPTGLPGGNFGTIALAVAPGTKGERVYDYVAQGMFRSDDGGEHWTRASDDPRLIGGGQFHDVIVDPRNANILFATQTSLYRSTDAGKTWESYTGAPSGADFNAAPGNPCKDQGNGAIPDSAADSRKSLEAAVTLAKQALSEMDINKAKSKASEVQSALSK